MLEVLPLSPVREWAISRSLIASALQEMDLRPGEFARQQDRRHRDDIARRFESAAASGGAIGVKRFDLVAYSDGLTQIFGTACDANAHLIGFVCLCRQIGPMQRVDADHVEPQLDC